MEEAELHKQEKKHKKTNKQKLERKERKPKNYIWNFYLTNKRKNPNIYTHYPTNGPETERRNTKKKKK